MFLSMLTTQIYIPIFDKSKKKVTNLKDLLYMMAYKTQGCIIRTPISIKKTTNIKHDGINIMNIINNNTFNLHNSLLNNDNRYIKVTPKCKLIGVAMLLISADYREF